MKQWRILVVDDEPLNLKIIGDYLDRPEYCIDFVESAAQAWAMLENREPAYHLAILDWMMPEVDGVALLRRMKADPRFRNIPIVLQSVADEPEQISIALAAGACAYLTKPYGEGALSGSVEAALRLGDFLNNAACMLPGARTGIRPAASPQPSRSLEGSEGDDSLPTPVAQ